MEEQGRLRKEDFSNALGACLEDSETGAKNSSKGGTATVITQMTRSDQEAEITATGIPPSNDLESAMVESLPANGVAYTAIVRGAYDPTGVALVEVYVLTN